MGNSMVVSQKKSKKNYHMIQNSVVQKGEELRAEWEKQNMVNPDYFHFA